MNPDFQLVSSSKVKDVFAGYPKHIEPLMLNLRDLVISVASKIEGLETLEETLKWGEPSYLTKGGSTLRFDWKPSKPDEYALYFNCKSKLVETFKELYREELTFDGNRAIVLKASEGIPADELKHCIALALTYHRVKHLPMLAA